MRIKRLLYNRLSLIIGLLAFITSFCWLCTNWDYEPLIGLLTSFGLLLGFFVEEKTRAIKTAGTHRSPNTLTRIFDRYFPRLHLFLAGMGISRKPDDYMAVSDYLTDLEGKIRTGNSVYIPLKSVQIESSALEKAVNSEVKSIFTGYKQIIRNRLRAIIKAERGGDGSTAMIAAMNRNCVKVKRIVSFLEESREPAIILGEPGSGKSKTLIELCYSLVLREKNKVHPAVIIYRRLGDFYMEGNTPLTSKDVLRFLEKDLPESLQQNLPALIREGRIVALFDGLDEISRDRYSMYNRLFSDFAAEYAGRIKTVFTCRVNDFSPNFVHRKIIILPFDRAQIKKYVRTYIKNSLVIEGQQYSIQGIARKIIKDVPLPTSNPFILFLVCQYILIKEKWPRNLSETMNVFIESSLLGIGKEKLPYNTSAGVEEKYIADAIELLSAIAFAISERNKGILIKEDDLSALTNDTIKKLVIDVAVSNRLLSREEEANEYYLRFEHHRIQEYLAAQYLLRHDTAFRWKDNLDSQRWQNTLFYMIEIDNNNPVLQTLVDSISFDYATFKSIVVLKKDGEFELHELVEWHAIEYDYSFRTELAARILGIKNFTNTGFLNTLHSWFEKSVDVLTWHGNPTTQARVILSAVTVPGISLSEYVRRLLASKINWLRNQALLIYSNSVIEKRKIGIKLSEEVFTDLSHGYILHNFPIYLKSVFNKKLYREIPFCLWGALLMTLYLLLLAAMPMAALLLKGSSLFEAGSFSLSDLLFMAAILIMSIHGSIKYPYRLWQLSIVLTILSLLPVSINLFIELREVAGLLAAIIISVAAIFFIPFLLLFIHLLLVGIMLLLYVLVAGLFNRGLWSEYRSSCFVSYEKFNFREYNNFFARGIGVWGFLLMSVFVAFLNTSFFENNIWPSLVKSWNYVYGFVYTMTVKIYPPVIIFVLLLLINMLQLKVKGKKYLEKILMIISVLPVVLIIAGIIIWIIKGIIQGILLVRNFFNSGNAVAEWIEYIYFGIVAIIVIGVGGSIILPALFKLGRRFMSGANSILGNIFKKSFKVIKEDDLLKELQKADAEGQVLLLRNVSKQALQLDTDRELLKIYILMEPDIKEEPAQSYYWRKRNELEIIVKQNEG